MDSLQVTGQDTFLLYTQDEDSRGRLATLLARYGQLVVAGLHHDPDKTMYVQQTPRLVFVDFNAPEGDPNSTQLESARRLCTDMAKRFPHVPRVALTRYDAGSVTVEALRAGASDCLDLSHTDDAEHTIRRLMEIPLPPVEANASPRGCSILILGGRSGMGVTTLATHLADIAQVRLSEAATPTKHRHPSKTATVSPRITRSCLLDLGMPAHDGLLYLGVPEGFHFLDAIHSLHRLDRTLLDSALPRDELGTGVLSFPPNLEDLRQVSRNDALALFNRLQDFFELTVVDAGGLGNPIFETSLALAAEHIWIVTDQSLGGLLSLASHMETLRTSDVDLHALRLVVNGYDGRQGLSAQQIADKFEIPLLGTLPESRSFLWQHPVQSGRSAQISSRHPYTRGVNRLLDLALEEDSCKKRAPVIRGLWDSLIPSRHTHRHSGGNS
jgi:pilus assembly protein CpaE